MNIAALLGLLAALACSDGSITGEVSPPETESSSGVQAPPAAAPQASETRLVRLSHLQYSNTLEDLFGLEEAPQLTFSPDSLNGFKFDTSSDLRVDQRLGPEYRASAERLAQRIESDSALFERIVPCDGTDSACPDQFVREFGERAFRRPLSGAEAARFNALFAEAASLAEAGDAFRSGVALVVEAMLQSPQFLYRTETSRGEVENGRAELDDWEVASRLSYFIYDSMPDEALFQRARRGELRSEGQIATEVARMLEDPRAVQKLVSFHEQLWQFGRYAKIAPDAETYPDLPEDLIDRLLASSDRFLASVMEEGGGLEEFLTAPYAFADAELARIYGSSAGASGNGMSRIEFSGGERKGFLMQLGFLASNAYAIKTDPIHRGLFVLRDILCRVIPDPPADAATTPPPVATEPIETTREEVSLLTGQKYCPSCHGQINEPGFAFEGFDAVGRVRELENGVPVDAAGSITLDGTSVRFDGASDLVEALAESQEARDCYVARWLEFAYGRNLAEAELSFRDRLAEEPRSVKDLVTTLATAPEFRTRPESDQ